MITKTVDIQYCGDCPHRYYKGNQLWCEKENRAASEHSGIPEWCPLPDTIEPVVVESLPKSNGNWIYHCKEETIEDAQQTINNLTELYRYRNWKFRIKPDQQA